VDFGEIRRQGEGFQETVSGLLQAAQVLERVAQVVESLGIRRFKGEGFFIAPDGFIGLTGAFQGIAQVVVVCSRRRIAADSVPDEVYGFTVPRTLHEQHPQEVESIGISGIVSDNTTVELFGFIEAAALVVSKRRFQIDGRTAPGGRSGMPAALVFPAAFSLL